MSEIKYPYLPEGRTIKYVSADDLFMRSAQDVARTYSLDKVMPGGAVIMRFEKAAFNKTCPALLGYGANGSEYHTTNGCERVRLGCKSGEGYDLCKGCSPKNHSEATAIRNAVESGNDTRGASLYLWGHWWFCKDCWIAMIAVGIKDVYLLENSEVLFNKEHPDNIVGRQFKV
ncbi:MAG: hypothetical protein Q7S28_04330 [bacterium]|nr:hypothetical protein [bacterium]